MKSRGKRKQKMVDLSPNMSVITLNVNDLTTKIKRQIGRVENVNLKRLHTHCMVRFI